MEFREDQRRVHKDHGPQNMNTLRQVGHDPGHRCPECILEVHDQGLPMETRE